MKISGTGIKLIKHFEGLHDGNLKKIGLQPKLCPAGIWTVGYGRTLKDKEGNHLRGESISLDMLKILHPNMIDITEEDAEKFLKEDLRVFENIVKRRLHRSILQREFDALVSHTYNTGGSGTLFSRVNEGDKEKIRSWWITTYITSNGVKLNGLISRRLAEWKLYNTGNF